MMTQRIGIADYYEMKARIMRIACGEEKPLDDPKVWFTSTESFARILSNGNRDLLRIIAEKAPTSLEELAEITHRAPSNLSRTLKTMAGHRHGAGCHNAAEAARSSTTVHRSTKTTGS